MTALAAHLRETLAPSRVALDAWVAAQKRQVAQQVAAAQQDLREQQGQLDGAAAQLLALQLQHGCHLNNNSSSNNDKAKNVLSEQRQKTERKVQQQSMAKERMQAQVAELEKKLEDVQMERNHVQERARAAQKNAQSVAAAKDMTVQDLTRGILNYKYLGLDFAKAEPDRLRFTFTQLDPQHPEQEYSFCLCANEDDLYSVVDCQPAPAPDPKLLDQLIAPLNQTNDMMAFVRGMRHMFLQRIRS